MGVVQIINNINLKCRKIDRPFPFWSQGTCDKCLNPIYGFGGNMKPDVNPECFRM